MFDRGLKLLDRDIASREYDLSVDLNGRELGQGRPLEQAEGRLLDDLNIKGILLFQLRDHGGDIVSPFALRVVEVEPDKHVSLLLVSYESKSTQNGKNISRKARKGRKESPKL